MRLSGPRPWHLLLPLLIALTLFGHYFHWLEAAGTAERDGFVDQADGLLHGKLPHDGFRPPLYAILTAGLGRLLGGDVFLAGRSISNVAAVGLAFVAFELGRRLRSTRAGLWAMALTAVNPALWMFGELASTDMLFACLAAAALVAGVAYLQRPTAGAAVAAGIFYGLADFVRSNGLLLLAPLALAFVLAPRQRSLRHVGYGCMSGAIILLPMWLLRWHEFGSPLHDENWKNLWWKLHGGADWSLLDRVPAGSLFGVLTAEPGPVARSAVHELATFGRFVLPNLAGGWWTVGIFGFAVARAFSERDRTRLFLFFALAWFLLALSCVFFVWDRFVLFWVPVVTALCFAELARTSSTGRLRLLLPSVGAALLLMTFARTAIWRLPEFVGLHPYAEVKLLRKLQQQAPPATIFAGSAPFLQRYLQHPYLAIPETHGPDEGERYVGRLKDFLATHQVSYLVVSDVELDGRPRWLLDASAPTAPTWLSPVRGEDGAVLWRVQADQGASAAHGEGR